MNMQKISFSAERGPRPHQEDYFTCLRFVHEEMDGWVLAVMDGHGGKDVAKICAENIDTLFNAMPNPDGMEHELQQLVFNLNALTDEYYAGSTISVACVLPSHNRVSVAVLGDSPVFVLDGSGKFHRGPTHNVRDNLVERKAAVKRGAVYENGYIYVSDEFGFDYGLQMSRALGDFRLRTVLSRMPKTYTVEDPVWVCVASDGLIEPMNGATREIVKEIEALALQGADANALVQNTAERTLRDNTTAVVWKK